MPKAADLIGQTFSRLTVIERLPLDKHYKVRWLCICTCGKTTIAVTAKLRNGHVQSCGCWFDETRKTCSKRHGYSSSHKEDGISIFDYPEYRVWAGMKSRCYQKNNKSYRNYGARGIVICDWWRHSFPNFYQDMGTRPPFHVIDRIDPNGNYCPENCRWVDMKLSAQNTRKSIWITFNNETLALSDWARKLNVPAERLRDRYHKGLSVEEILFKPVYAVRFREALTHKIPD